MCAADPYVLQGSCGLEYELVSGECLLHVVPCVDLAHDARTHARSHARAVLCATDSNSGGYNSGGGYGNSYSYQPSGGGSGVMSILLFIGIIYVVGRCLTTPAVRCCA